MTDQTDELGPDEKYCPFCAEVIKAAAIRCRWCGSDLPADTPQDAAAVPAATPATPASAATDRGGPNETVEDRAASLEAGLDTGREPDAGSVGWARWLLTGALVFVLVLAGTVLVRQLMAQGSWSAVPEGNSPLAAGAVVQGDEAKQSAMMAATSATEQVLSYDAATFDEDVEASLALLDGEMEEQYSSTMEAIGDKTAENKAAVEASVVAVSTISATEHDAKLLLFVNQQTTGKHLDQPRVDLNRVVVTIHRGEGDWKITKLEAM